MKVSLGTLKDKGDDLVAFLEPRVGTKPSLSGGEIEIEDEAVKEGVRPRHVKTYIKRFLYMNGVRKKYRVFVAGKELTIQEIELGEKTGKEEEKEKKAPEKKVEDVEAEPAEEEAGERAKGEAAEEQKPAKARKAAAKKPRSKKKKSDEED